MSHLSEILTLSKSYSCLKTFLGQRSDFLPVNIMFHKEWDGGGNIGTENVDKSSSSDSSLMTPAFPVLGSYRHSPAQTLIQSALTREGINTSV